MYKVVLVLVWLKEVKEVVVVTVETDCHLGLEMVVVTVVMDCHLCLEHLVSQGSRSQGSGMDGQTPEGNVPSGFQNTMPQQQQPQQQQQANVSQNAQGFASTTNLDASGQGCPVQGCQQGNMSVVHGQDQHGLVRNGFPNKRLCNRMRKRVYRVMVVRVCLVDQDLVVFQT